MIMAEKRVLSKEYWEWRKAVLARDKCKCQYPGCRRKKNLQVHHIIRWADCYELRYSVANSISLCRTHHRKVTGNETIYADLFLTIIRSKSKKK